jgi:4-amino-4-deoxy-L-arabinose transferase-like glycosyltransferase
VTTTTAADGVLGADDAPPSTEAPVPSPSPSPSRFAAWLGGFALLGFVVRVLNVLWWRPTTRTPGYHGYRLWGDALYYHWQANALAKGHWFVDPLRWLIYGNDMPSAGHPPFYTTYLALWSAIGLDGVTAHRLASSVLGTATIVLVGLFVRKLAGGPAGLVAAGIAAIYPEIWISDGMVMSETAVIFATVVVLSAIYLFWRAPRLRNAVIMGAAVSLATLARSELVLLFPFVVLPLTLRVQGADWGRRLKLLGASAAVGALVLAPWVGFNMSRFAEPTTITAGQGAVLSAASCDRVWYGSWIGYYANCFQGPWPPASQDESQRDAEPRRQAIDYTKDHIKRLPLVVAARVGRVWDLFKPGQTTAFDWWIEGRGRAASWIGLFMYYALMPFAIYGIVVMFRRRITIIPMLAIPLITTIAAGLTFGVTRYRAPSEVVIVATAAIGITACWSRWRERRGHAPAVSSGPGASSTA